METRSIINLIGGMELAFTVTRAKLGVSADTPMTLEFYPKPRGFFSRVTSDILKIENRPLPKVLEEAIEPLALIAEFYDGKPLMLMPYQIEIE